VTTGRQVSAVDTEAPGLLEKDPLSGKLRHGAQPVGREAVSSSLPDASSDRFAERVSGPFRHDAPSEDRDAVRPSPSRRSTDRFAERVATVKASGSRDRTRSTALMD
jgi:hypothetical protein